MRSAFCLRRLKDFGSEGFVEVIAMGFNQLAESDELILDEALERQRILETVINNSPIMAFLWTPDEDWPVRTLYRCTKLSCPVSQHRVSSFMGKLFIPKTCFLWNSNLRRTARKGEKNSIPLVKKPAKVQKYKR